jgi:hypothetical protein
MDELRREAERQASEAQAKLDRIATLVSHAEFDPALGYSVVRASDLFEILAGEKRQRSFP